MFEIIYADPPWAFSDQKTGGGFVSGASQKYPVMPLSAIQQLPVQAICRANAVLFLWVPTSMKFSHGATVMNNWGFEYKTTIYWEKIRKGRRMGMGRWFRNEVEELLVGVHGSVKPFGCQLPNIVHAPVEEHSAKPDAFYRLIESATGTALKSRNVEMFARKKEPGWTGIGNQVTGRTIQADLLHLARTSADPGTWAASWGVKS